MNIVRVLRKSPVQTFLLVPLATVAWEWALGMLHVELVHEVPEAAKPRKIAIGSTQPVQPQVTEHKAA